MSPPGPRLEARPPRGTVRAERGVLFLAALASLLIVAWLVSADASLPRVPPLAPRALSLVLAAGYVLVLGSTFLRPSAPCGALAAVSGGAGLTLAAGLAAALAWKAGPRSSLVVSLLLLGTSLGVAVVGFVLAQVFLVRGGLALWLLRGRSPGAFAVFVVTAFATVAALATGRNLTREKEPPPRPALAPDTPEQVARGSLNLALPCLARYALQHGRYPSSFSDIAPGGTGCLPWKYGEGHIPGYRIVYEPAPPESATSPWGGFSLRYEPLDAAKRSPATLETDETGLVFEGVGADRKPERLAVSHAGQVGFLQGCVEKHRLQGGTGRYPDHLEETSPTTVSCLLQGMAPDREAPKLAARLHGYRFSYTPLQKDASGRVLDYRLDARPVAYGRPFTRSYMCDTQGRMRATDEDRPAEHADPSTGWDAVLQEEKGTPCHTPDWWEALLRRPPSPLP